MSFQHEALESNPEGLAIKSLQDIHDTLDPRLHLSRTENTDGIYDDQTVEIVRSKDVDAKFQDDVKQSVSTCKTLEETSGPLYVDFEKDDPREPANFSKLKKWTILCTATIFTIQASMSAASYPLGFPSMIKDLNCTEFQANIGIAVFPLGFGVVPLVTASFSEEFGRQPLYLMSTIGFLLMHVMVALSKNIQTVIVGRFLAGAFGSTGATMVGGTVADLFLPHERGTPMALFSAVAVAFVGVGPVYAGWIEINPHMQWRWIQWIHVILAGAFLLMVPTLMTETRSAIILTRLAKRMRRETGNNRYRARVEDERASLWTLIYVSCTRPLYLLFTEPLVLSWSIWLGFIWGIMYGMIESVGPVFRDLHGFNAGSEGLAFLGTVVGAVIGFGTNFYQEVLYEKYYPKRGPEARIISACAAAILFPIGMFIYAWSSYPWVFWIALEVGLTIFMWAAFVLYLAAFTYLADCYGIYASSALAGQSLLRCIMAMAFPLFTEQMFDRLTYKWANTIFGCIGVLIIPLPFILYYYGPAIRARSKFSRAVIHSDPAERDLIASDVKEPEP